MTLAWIALDANFGSGSSNPTADIQALAAKYRELPRHIAKKHMKAAMRATIRTGVPILKKNTPKQKSRLVLGRNVRSGEYTARKVKGGSLRRAATVRTGTLGRNTDYDQVVFAVLGYRYGWESRKAIWLERGTSHGVRAQRMVEKTLAEFGKPCAATLAAEMAARLEKAAAEIAGGRNIGPAAYRSK